MVRNVSAGSAAAVATLAPVQAPAVQVAALLVGHRAVPLAARPLVLHLLARPRRHVMIVR